MIIKDSLLELEGSFSGLLQGGKESRIEKGSFVRSVFTNFIDPAVVQCLDLLVEYLSNLTSATFSAKGRGVTKLLDFLRGAFNEQVKMEDLETLYKVYIMLDKGKGDKGNEGCNFFKSKSKNVVFSVPKWPVYGRARPSRRAFGENSPSKARIFVILPVYM